MVSWLRQKFSEPPLWLPLFVFLGLALLIRIPYMPGNGFHGDLGIFQDWISAIQSGGVFNFYAVVQERPYPPLSILLLASAGGDFASIKLPSVIAELLLVAVAYVWLRRDALLRWAIPLILALHPGLILTTAWWGQNDALFTLAIVLVLIALNRDRPLVAWALFGVALATKQQSIVIAPLIAILSLRRYGWQRTILGGAAAALIVIGLVLPFILATGFEAALAPYTAVAGAASSISNHAFNLWYIVAALSGIATSTLDTTPFIASLTYSQTGLLLLIGYTAAISVVIWKQAERRREFVWACALYVGTFTLQTQIHERYLYPAAVLALLAIYQQRRMVLVAAGIALTFTYNVIALAVPTVWLGLPLVTSPLGELPVALLNVILLVALLWIVLRPLLTRGAATRAVRQTFLRVLRVSAAGLMLVVFFTNAGMALGSYAVAQWLGANSADRSHIALDSAARYTSLLADVSFRDKAWEWSDAPNVIDKPSSTWLAEGVHYLLVDMTDAASALSKRQALAGEATTLLYEYQSRLRLGPDLAVLWTFRPDHPLNVTFNDSLELIGYHVLDADGAARLLFHWYLRQPTSVDYTAFIHLIDAETGALIGQADAPLGGGTHPTSTWRRNELVFETIALPVVNRPYFIRMGLYQADLRASIRDAHGNALGDSIEFHP